MEERRGKTWRGSPLSEENSGGSNDTGRERNYMGMQAKNLQSLRAPRWVACTVVRYPAQLRSGTYDLPLFGAFLEPACPAMPASVVL